MKLSKIFVFLATVVLLMETGFVHSDNGTEAQWQQLKGLRGIASGNTDSPPTAYVFFDANCPYSAKLNKNGFGVLGLDSRRVKWIPVAYMRPNSGAKAAALLRAGSYEAIIKNYQSFNFAKYEGSVAGVTPTSGELLTFEKSMAVLNSITTSPGTPMIIYKDKSGAIKVQGGLPLQPSNSAQPGMGAYNE